MGDNLNLIIKNDDEIIGYVADIRAFAKEWLDDDVVELLFPLKDYDDDDLVRCWYHPMGSWYIARLVES